MKTEELEAVGGSTGLILLNILLMGLLSYTPVAGLLGFVFGVHFFVGVLVFGGMLTAGDWLAERGIEDGDHGRAALGTGILQFAYGSFGAGLLAGFSPSFQFTALAVTAGVTVLLTLVSGAIVYGTGRDFSSWRRYANYLFLGVLGGALLTLVSYWFVLVSFIFALLGFLALLVYEIWDMRTSPSKVYLNAVGIYVAFMGVFIQILQIVLEMMEE